MNEAIEVFHSSDRIVFHAHTLEQLELLEKLNEQLGGSVNGSLMYPGDDEFSRLGYLVIERDLS